MFDAQCDYAALVYERDESPDAILRDFAADLNARGFRVIGMVQSGQCADGSLSVGLVHSGEVVLLAQDATSSASGCKLDLGRLQDAAARVAGAMDAGTDLVMVNRFGKRERDGKGLSHVIERALDADIPVVIAVASEHFADWIKRAGEMTVKLVCDRSALDQWWRNVSTRETKASSRDHQTDCDFK